MQHDVMWRNVSACLCLPKWYCL